MSMAVLIALALQGTLPDPPPRDLFDLLEGEWVCRQAMLAGGPVYRRETWRGREDGDASGQLRSFPPRASGTESPPEVELLYQRGRRTPRLAYSSPAGVWNGAVYYRVARSTPREVVFERTRNGTPRIISYRLTAADRLEVMHGLENGGSRRWTYQRRGAGDAIIGCDGRR
jgi:hypothetical protein